MAFLPNRGTAKYYMIVSALLFFILLLFLLVCWVCVRRRRRMSGETELVASRSNVVCGDEYDDEEDY
jgi:flagellar biogenesis protein FliO